MDLEKTGRLIARKRKEQGWTREQLSEKIGVTPQAICNWEKGKRYPDYGDQIMLFKILGLNPVELITGLEMYDTKLKADVASFMKRMNEKVFVGGVATDEDGNKSFFSMSGYEMMISDDGEDETGRWVPYLEYYNALPPVNPLKEEILPVSDYDSTKIYLNQGHCIFTIPVELLESVGKPLYFDILTKMDQGVVALRFTDEMNENSFDIPEKIYSGKWKGLHVLGGELTGMLCKAMGIRRWIDTVCITPCYNHKQNALFLLLDSAKRVNVEMDYSKYLLPQWQYDALWEDDDEDEEQELG